MMWFRKGVLKTFAMRSIDSKEKSGKIMKILIDIKSLSIVGLMGHRLKRCCLCQLEPYTVGVCVIYNVTSKSGTQPLLKVLL